MPGAPAEPGLRDVQFALAREHGLPGWAALCQALEDAPLLASDLSAFGTDAAPAAMSPIPVRG